MPASSYKDFFFTTVRNDGAAVFHNADLRPPYDHATAVTYYETDRPVTVKARLRAKGGNYWAQKLMIYLITERPWGQLYRRLIDWARERLPNPVVWRNYEASYDVLELEPNSRKDSTYVLQEYFIPVEKFDEFRPRMAEILNRYKVNALNVSVRHAKADPGSTLAWARQEVFAFVLYHKQSTSEAAKGTVAVWTRELIDAALASGGAYYLPYQLHARPDQFHAAYPRAREHFELKKKLDPTGKFTNKLWDKYYFGKDTEQEPQRDPKSNFKTVYNSTRLRDRFYRYLQNIFHIYPEEKLHQVLLEETMKGPSDDKAIYQAAEPRVKAIKPFLAPLRYALPALAVQKDEMADETAELLGERGRQPINGYLEWGTLGRYVTPLKARLNMKGPVYVASYQPMSFSPEAIFERGGLRRPGKYIENHAGPITPEQVPDASVDLITVYPGLHHHPLKKLDPFVASLWRILRPGGRLVIRDHDVLDADADQFTGLVHDVYNLGVGEHWDNNEKEIRHFTSNDGLAQAMLGRGFRDTGKRIHQKNDPTQNVLMEFEKIDKPGEPAGLSLHDRKAEMTYLTLPEWYIVYASREYAQALAQGWPSQFDYWGAVTQFWGEYRRALKNAGKGATNVEAQLMLLPIGISHSLEFLIKGAYEKTLGALFEPLDGEYVRADALEGTPFIFVPKGRGMKTAQDLYAQSVAQQYIDFIDLTPWYKFPYGEKLAGLWKVRPLEGQSRVRGWERTLFLTGEYSAKYVLAGLFKFLVKYVFPPESLVTAVVAKDVPASLRQEELYRYEDGRVAFTTPRYGPFTGFVTQAAAAGATFEKIAGNDSVSLTALVAADAALPEGVGETLGRYGLLNSPKTQRVQLRVPVKDLARAVNALRALGATIEHVYDF
jgi:SAM-dependent methyltransferase